MQIYIQQFRNKYITKFSNLNFFMESYTDSKGEKVIISEMDSTRLIHAIAKYAAIAGGKHNGLAKDDELVKALKLEAMKRLSTAA